MSVGLVVVSHSEKLAQGVVELAAQMARDVTIVAAGGTEDAAGGTVIGTSLERVMNALSTADTGHGVLVLTDLGSAVMTAESALEFMGDPDTIELADAPLVEGTIAAAVAAQSGASLADVRKAAETAIQPKALPDPGASSVAGAAGETTAGPAPDSDRAGSAGPLTDVLSSALTLINPLGLHARPAAVLAGALGAMDVDIDINGVDGQSVMMLMSLGAGEGKILHVKASGPDAKRAVDLIRAEVERGFGEL
jgi:PTS hybrid protein